MRRSIQHKSKPVAVGQNPRPLTIEKPIYGGSFLGRVDGKAHFVPFALPGEEVVARALEEKKSFARCELVSIEKPARERIAPRCPHFTHCGGCDYQHADYETQLGWKRAILEETFLRAGIAVPDQVRVLAAEPWGYRNRIRLAVDATGGLGYRERNSHRVARVHECPIAAPQLMVAAQELEAALKQLPAIGVEEIELFTAPAGESLLARILAHSPRTGWLERLARLTTTITGAMIARSPGAKAIEQTGMSTLNYEVAGQHYEIANGAFFQVNQYLLDDFVEYVSGWADSATRRVAWDLYCGAGLFAKRLAAHYEKVIAVESAPPAVESLRANLDHSRCEVVESTVEVFLKSAAASAKPDLVIADPPRAGLGQAVASHLNCARAERIIYISCDPATMARDLVHLANYSVQSIAMADLFPQTFHLETIAVLGLK